VYLWIKKIKAPLAEKQQEIILLIWQGAHAAILSLQ
jgi:hypothetical protein